MAERSHGGKGEGILVLGSCNSLPTRDRLFLPLCCKFRGCFPFAYLQGTFPLVVLLQTGIPSFRLICLNYMEVAESVGLTFFQHETSYFGDLLMFSADSLPPGQSSVPCTEHVSSVETGGLHKGF